jgi:hypothetical protein
MNFIWQEFMNFFFEWNTSSIDASQNLLPPNHTKYSRGIFVLPVETNIHNIVLVCLFCKIPIFHTWFEYLYA